MKSSESPMDQNSETPEANETSEFAAAENNAAEQNASAEAPREDGIVWQEKYLRTLAEFDNYRKRTRSETEGLRQFVAESLVMELLPVMDDFDRVLAAVESEENPYRKGIEMVRDKLRAFFQSQGVTRSECQGHMFDPEEHDALMMRPMANFPAGVILDVITPGYKMGDKIIRHAQVVVSADADESEEK